MTSTPFTDSLMPKDSSSDEALTAIVISQRERFRIRNMELESVRDHPIDPSIDPTISSRKMSR